MNKRVLIVAEMSANHNGDKEVALETVRAAKRAGADAIKIQTYTADTITLDCDKEDFQIRQGTLWDGQTLYNLYQQAYTPWEWHKDIFDEAERLGLLCFSTPFDFLAVDFLEILGNPIYKIASFEITDIPLIEYAASKGKPMVISIGIATEEDINLAVEACRRVGNNDITLLKCTSSYPAPIEEANMCMLKDIAERFGVKVGLSDHTIGAICPIVATTMGATLIEKHFILDRSIGGPDAAFSMNEAEFTDMVKMIRDVEKCIGIVDYSLSEKQIANRIFARSLYVAKDIKKGDIITTENVRSVRPSLGLHPKYYNDILGKRVNQDLHKGDRMSFLFVKDKKNEKY